MLAEKRILPKNSAIHFPESRDTFHVYLKAEIIKKKLPLRVLATPEGADYILWGTAQRESRGYVGALEIWDTKGVLIWAGEAGDSVLSRKGGVRQIAERLADKLEKIIRRR